MNFACLLLYAAPALLFSSSVSATKFSEYILAPSQRFVAPKALREVHGTVNNPGALLLGSGNGTEAVFIGSNSSVTLDFGVNIGGTVEFDITSVSGTDEFLGFSFTESSLWISPYQGDSASNATYDSPLWFKIPSAGRYAAAKERQRGGFRYMSIWHNSTGSVSVKNLSVNFTASPEIVDLQKYPGYFNSDSEKLNRVWYAGAYTNQLCTADPAYGNALGIPGNDWYYNATISNGTSVLMDGAKRDRLVWPGDIAISGPSMFVSTNSLDGIKNGIDSLFVLQQADGRLPWAGTPFTSAGRFQFSFTYHLYTLLDLYDYVLFTGDVAYAQTHWDAYKRAMNWSLSTIDSSGMANVTSSNDWLRSGMGGHNVEANSIFYHTLNTGIQLATELNDSSVTARWSSAASSIRDAVNTRLWDPAQNLFFDNDTAAGQGLNPQDGNAWAVVSNITAQHPSRAPAISAALAARWVRPFGAPAPEAGATISPFATGFEVQAHYLAGHPERAEELVEFMWADFMLDDPRMTNSSFIEGYATDGTLHYAPYDNDARISYAHGWATGPTSALTFLGAGLRVTGPAGRTWEVRPRLGGIDRVEAGFVTPRGEFAVEWVVREGGAVTGGFRTPEGTSGTLILPFSGAGVALSGPSGAVQPSSKDNSTVVFADLPGGNYTVGSG